MVARSAVVGGCDYCVTISGLLGTLRGEGDMRKTTWVYRLMAVREGTVEYDGKPLNNSQRSAAIVKNIIGQADREVFVVVGLDTRLQPIYTERVSVGELNTTVVHPREVFKGVNGAPGLVGANCFAWVCGHNHPSGDTMPSAEDIAITDRLISASEIMGIQLLDHVIIGDQGYYSFADQGRIPKPVGAGRNHEIFERWLQGAEGKELAGEFGLSESRVSSIVSRYIKRYYSETEAAHLRKRRERARWRHSENEGEKQEIKGK